MKIISLVSSRPGMGQTTVAVNLAAGLAGKGIKVLICNLNSSEKLYHWLGIQVREGTSVSLSPDLQVIKKYIYASKLGIDVLYLGSHPTASSFQSNEVMEIILDLDYDYLILNPGGRLEDLIIAAQLADNVIACTDLNSDDELLRLERLQKEMLHLSDGRRGINLILPCKVNINKWESNANSLFSIGDYFGYEKIADLIPNDHRIHPLRINGKTVWELQNTSLRDAFSRLLERVENL